MSVYTGESRGELLAWINGLLGTDIKKLEELGSGAVYCQIMDSIYGNLPMSRVKYNARADYDFLDNFKVLQACFKRNGIDKPIPVDKLVKCKMQDNLEFCQWMKKFWDSAARGDHYDAAARSGGQTVTSSAPPARRPAGAGVSSARTVSRSNPIAGARAPSAAALQVQEMREQVEDLTAAHAEMLAEREFYFKKLTDVDVIIKARLEEEGVTDAERENLVRITAVLYDAGDAGEEEQDQIADEQLEETY